MSVDGVSLETTNCFYYEPEVECEIPDNSVRTGAVDSQTDTNGFMIWFWFCLIFDEEMLRNQILDLGDAIIAQLG